MWLPLMHPLLETWPETQACALTGNRTSDSLVHRSVLAQSTEPRQPATTAVFKAVECIGRKHSEYSIVSAESFWGEELPEKDDFQKS